MIYFFRFCLIKCSFVFLVLVLVCTQTAAPSAAVSYTAEFPYHVGAGTAKVQPGGVFQGRLCLLHTDTQPALTTITLTLPSIITPLQLPVGWSYHYQDHGGVLRYEQRFNGGYEHWFELLQFQVATVAAAHDYPLVLTVATSAGTQQETIVLSINERRVANSGTATIQSVLVPYDKHSGDNSSLDNGTLLLRHSELDYYRNLFAGRGTISGAAQAAHPLAQMKLVWSNPEQQARLLLLHVRLLDKVSGQPVPGLVSPQSGVDAEQYDSGMGRITEEHMTALIELDGQLQQVMELPLYVDEGLIKGGDYNLQLTAMAGDTIVTQTEMPVRVVALNTSAGLVTILAVMIAIGGISYILGRRRLKVLTSRHLITAGLFGATAFAVVNIPGTFLNDILHILLGPFSFLISGMFSGVLLYMLLVSLVVVIPQFGIVSLMLLVRMLINMLVFGHISPLSLVVYGVQAAVLEAALWITGWTRCTTQVSRRIMMLTAIACGLADAIATFINLQLFSFLYRLYYADWYILLCMLVSGFLYPLIGALGGIRLGQELKKVGVD